MTRWPDKSGGVGVGQVGLATWICKMLLFFQLEDGSEVSRGGGYPALKK